MALRMVICPPIVHDHASWAVWRARAATVPHEVRGAAIEPPAIRIVRLLVPVSVEVMLNAIA